MKQFPLEEMQRLFEGMATADREKRQAVLEAMGESLRAAQQEANQPRQNETDGAGDDGGMG